MDKIGVIDLFAGPGGLGEGFSAYQSDSEGPPFKILASVEHERSAHQTLTLRAFYRQFPKREVPSGYYDYIRNGAREPLEKAFSEYGEQVQRAREETLNSPCSLGKPDHDEFIHHRIRAAVAAHRGPRVVIGGPPCQAYSLVGRARNRGIIDYRPEADTRHYLYKEYLRVLEEVEPEVFVMENVKGILTSRVHGEKIFPRIREDLENPSRAIGYGRSTGYRLIPMTCRPSDASGYKKRFDDNDFIIRAEDYGVPQARHRVIVIGVRNDLADEGEQRSLLTKGCKSDPVSVADVLADLPRLRSGVSKRKDSADDWAEVILAGLAAVRAGLSGMADAQGKAVEAAEGRMKYAGRGGNFVRAVCSKVRMPEELKDWLDDPLLGGYLNHETRGHMARDLHRYLFASCYADSSDGISPRTSEYPLSLAPAHRSWATGSFADRFKVQAANRVASTITSHIAKDGHYFIHYDPVQCRSLTVREAARLQTFPDNYYFCGGRTQQYIQVGNAVPPFLAKTLAETVHGIIKLNSGRGVTRSHAVNIAD